VRRQPRSGWAIVEESNQVNISLSLWASPVDRLQISLGFATTFGRFEFGSSKYSAARFLGSKKRQESPFEAKMLFCGRVVDVG